MTKDELLAILVCPMAKAPLRREGDTLVCTRCGPRFAIQDEIPNMLITEAELPEGCAIAGGPAVRQSRRCQARLTHLGRSQASQTPLLRSCGLRLPLPRAAANAVLETIEHQVLF